MISNIKKLLQIERIWNYTEGKKSQQKQIWAKVVAKYEWFQRHCILKETKIKKFLGGEASVRYIKATITSVMINSICQLGRWFWIRLAFKSVNSK